MNLYWVIKHLHLAMVVLAVLGFGLRFARQAGLLPRHWGRGLLRLSDLGLLLALASGLGLAWLDGQTSVSQLRPWLLEKLLLLVAALLLALYALRRRLDWPGRWLAMLTVVGLLYAVAELAIHKRPLLLG